MWNAKKEVCSQSVQDIERFYASVQQKEKIFLNYQLEMTNVTFYKKLELFYLDGQNNVEFQATTHKEENNPIFSKFTFNFIP